MRIRIRANHLALVVECDKSKTSQKTRFIDFTFFKHLNQPFKKNDFFRRTVHDNEDSDFILQSIQDNVRMDGRLLLESRKLTLETRGFLSSFGSSKVTVNDGSIVTCSIGLDVGPIPLITCTISPEKDWVPQSRFIVQTLEFLKDSLVISPSHAWNVSVNLTILKVNGCILDALFDAVKAALSDTLLPKVIIEEIDGLVDFRVTDEEIPLIADWPCILTLGSLADKIILDPNGIEEASCDCLFTFLFTRNGSLLTIEKHGHGSVSPLNLTRFIATAKSHASTLFTSTLSTSTSTPMRH